MKRAFSVLCPLAVLAALAAPPLSAHRFLPQAAAPAVQPAAVVVESTACVKTWVGRETEVEEFLRTAPIEKITELPIGVTKPKRAYFGAGGPVASAAWKPLPPGFRQGFEESYKAEIAAYEIDKLLGIHMVPPYVERRIDGKTGAVAFWVENVHAWDMTNPARGPNRIAWDYEIVRMKMFDQLIGNIDRNQGNLLYDDEYHLILIDHSRALTDTKDLTKMTKLTRVDRELWQRMLALDEAALEAAVGQWCDKGERKAILARRDSMKQTIDKMIAEKGETAVFLPALSVQTLR